MPVSLQITEQPGSWEQFLGTAVCTCLVTCEQMPALGRDGAQERVGCEQGACGETGGECGLSIYGK